MSTPARGSVTPPAALAFATVGFVALVIAGFGLTSLFAGEEVIGVPGLGPLPGVLGLALATVAFAAVCWLAVRVRHPSYRGTVAVTAATFVAYLAGVWVGAVVSGVNVARATAAAGGFAISGFALVLLGAAFVCAWAAVALVRTRSRRPRWPWERADEP